MAVVPATANDSAARVREAVEDPEADSDSKKLMSY
jgi:hypothetical protein